jgi:tetratricopeptide (TPR) repeat protein/thiol-disulfide isomerase/thioredoxin
VLNYNRSWAAVNKMLRSGRSYSGRERDCAFLNVGQRRFAAVAASMGVDLPDDSRALALVDWDQNGTLDMWITTRTSPAVRFFKNTAPAENGSLTLELEGKTCNRDAIGARVELVLDDPSDKPRIRTLRAGDGYLAQSTKRIHFGLGTSQTIKHVVVRWPGGEPETFTGLVANRSYRLVQGAGKPLENPQRGAVQLAAKAVPTAPVSDRARVVVLRPGELPEMNYFDANGEVQPLKKRYGKPLLVNLWATWCKPCLVELNEWAAARERLDERGVGVLTLCVDDPGESLSEAAKRAAAAAKNLKLPFDVGVPADGLVETLEVVQRTYIGRQRPLPLPASFLIDAAGRVSVIYRGPVTVQQLLADIGLLNGDHAARVNAAVPFAGQWLKPPGTTAPSRIALTFIDAGHLPWAEAHLERLIASYEARQASQGKLDNAALSDMAQATDFLGRIRFDQKKFKEAAAYYERSLAIAPQNRELRLELVRTYSQLGAPSKAAEQLAVVLESKRDDPETLARLAHLKRQTGALREAIDLLKESLAVTENHVVRYDLASTHLASGDLAAAMAEYRKILAARQSWPPAANDLAWILATHPNDAVRNGTEAVAIAEELVRVTAEQPSANFLGTLAAAYAEAQKFDQAIRTCQKAIEVETAAATKAKVEADQKLVAAYRERIKGFERRVPYRDSSLPPIKSPVGSSVRGN